VTIHYNEVKKTEVKFPVAVGVGESRRESDVLKPRSPYPIGLAENMTLIPIATHKWLAIDYYAIESSRSRLSEVCRGSQHSFERSLWHRTLAVTGTLFPGLCNMQASEYGWRWCSNIKVCARTLDLAVYDVASGPLRRGVPSKLGNISVL
jgi:hypothetical protein